MSIFKYMTIHTWGLKPWYMKYIIHENSIHGECLITILKLTWITRRSCMTEKIIIFCVRDNDDRCSNDEWNAGQIPRLVLWRSLFAQPPACVRSLQCVNTLYNALTCGAISILVRNSSKFTAATAFRQVATSNRTSATTLKQGSNAKITK